MKFLIPFLLLTNFLNIDSHAVYDYEIRKNIECNEESKERLQYAIAHTFNVSLSEVVVSCRSFRTY